VYPDTSRRVLGRILFSVGVAFDTMFVALAIIFLLG